MYQLPDDGRAKFEELLNRLLAGSAGLSDSIRAILSANPRKWYTAAQVRDALSKSGFDFTNYTSNPLASIHSALKRLKPEEAEMTTNDGVMAWRWKIALNLRRRPARRTVISSLGSLYGASNSLANLMSTKAWPLGALAGTPDDGDKKK